MFEVDLNKYPKDVLQLAIIALCYYAVDGENGRTVGDPVFEMVTEGRQSRQDKLCLQNPKIKRYSACGDLGHWVLKSIGCEDETLVNRSDDGGKTPWMDTKNLIMLDTSKYWQWWSSRGDKIPETGDIIIVSPPEHVLILESMNIDMNLGEDQTGEVTVYEYGKIHKKTLKAAGQKNTHQVKKIKKDIFIDNRKILGWLKMKEIKLTKPAQLPDDFKGTLEQ